MFYFLLIITIVGARAGFVMPKGAHKIESVQCMDGTNSDHTGSKNTSTDLKNLDQKIEEICQTIKEQHLVDNVEHTEITRDPPTLLDLLTVSQRNKIHLEEGAFKADRGFEEYESKLAPFVRMGKKRKHEEAVKENVTLRRAVVKKIEEESDPEKQVMLRIEQKKLIEQSGKLVSNPETDSLTASLMEVRAKRIKIGKTALWMDFGAGAMGAQRSYFKAHEQDSHGVGLQAIAIATFVPEQAVDEIGEFSKKIWIDGSTARYYPYFPEKIFISEAKGKADIITDVHGALDYSHNPTDILLQYGNYLAPEGRAYILNPPFSVNILDGSGTLIPLHRFITDHVEGFDVEVEGLLLQAIRLTRNAKALKVPSLKFIEEDKTVVPYIKTFRMLDAPAGKTLKIKDHRVVVVDQ